MKTVSLKKRILLMFIVAWISFMSVFNAYQETTQCAEWIAGTIATIGASPLLSALLIGGVVVAGGVAVYKIATTDAEDYRNFAQGIKDGFNQFVADQEKQIALEQDSSLTDQEAADIGVANARETVNDFWSKAVSTTKQSVEDIKLKAIRYWNLYSKIIGDVADNGITTSIEIGDPLPKNAQPELDLSNWATLANEINTHYSTDNQTMVLDGSNYIYQGDYYYHLNGTNTQFRDHYANDGRIPFIYIDVSNADYVDVGTYYSRTTSGEIWGLSEYQSRYYRNPASGQNSISQLIAAMSISSLPIIFKNGSRTISEWLTTNTRSNYLSVNAGSLDEIPVWKRTINNTLTNTKIGESIQTGRKQLVNQGDWIGSIFQEDSIPIRKTGLQVNDGVATGEIGWDIPLPSTWDDYLAGNIPFPDVVGGTGALGIPYPDINNPAGSDTTVDYPVDTPVQDTADYPREGTDDPAIDDSKPQEIPDKPMQDVLEDQGGTFFPAVMDLTNIFPFCIPFDIIYLVNKFDVHGNNAPVITIPIEYPNLIKSQMGSDHYDVVIDFEDFIVLRNILRTFLLILFIVGLLKITRDLIRG